MSLFIKLVFCQTHWNEQLDLASLILISCLRMNAINGQIEGVWPPNIQLRNLLSTRNNPSRNTVCLRRKQKINKLHWFTFKTDLLMLVQWLEFDNSIDAFWMQASHVYTSIQHVWGLDLHVPLLSKQHFMAAFSRMYTSPDAYLTTIFGFVDC